MRETAIEEILIKDRLRRTVLQPADLDWLAGVVTAKGRIDRRRGIRMHLTDPAEVARLTALLPFLRVYRKPSGWQCEIRIRHVWSLFHLLPNLPEQLLEEAAALRWNRFAPYWMGAGGPPNRAGRS